MKQTARIVFTVLMLYVLSVGPAERFQQLGIVHRPLYRIALYRAPGTLLASYVNLWLSHNDYAIWDPRMGVIVIEGNSLDSR